MGELNLVMVDCGCLLALWWLYLWNLDFVVDEHGDWIQGSWLVKSLFW